MNRIILSLIAALAVFQVASESFAGDFSTEVHDLLVTIAVGYDVETVSSGGKSNAYTSIASLHDESRLGWDPILMGTGRHVETKSAGYNSDACSSFGSVGVASYCAPPTGR